MLKSFCMALTSCAALLLCLAPARADSVAGETTVVLNSSTVTALTAMGLSLDPLGKATFDSLTMTLSFPITSGTIGGSGDTFKDDGSGFSLTSGSNSITFRNFVINTGSGTVSGNVHFGNMQQNGVTLFDIGPGGVLTFDARAAADLASALGMSNIAGISFGTATIDIPMVGDPGDVAPTPEPSLLGLLGGSFLVIGGVVFLRNRHRTQVPQVRSGCCNHEA